MSYHSFVTIQSFSLKVMNVMIQALLLYSITEKMVTHLSCRSCRSGKGIQVVTLYRELKETAPTSSVPNSVLILFFLLYSHITTKCLIVLSQVYIKTGHGNVLLPFILYMFCKQRAGDLFTSRHKKIVNLQGGHANICQIECARTKTSNLT